MTFYQEYLILMAKMRDSINSKVERSVSKSKLNGTEQKCIYVRNIDLSIIVGSTELSRIHNNLLVSETGETCEFEAIPFEDLCGLVDALNDLY